MKEFWKSGVVILLIIAVLYILFLRECKHPLPCPPDGQVLISQQAWDSIKAIANMQPIIHIDTIVGPTVYVPTGPNNPPPDPQPDPVDTTINVYSDSLIEKDINVHYDFRVRGILLDRSWSYNPIVIHRIDSIPYPKIVDNPYEVLVSQRGLYVYGTAGGNDKAFLFGGGLDYITKKSTTLGYFYQRYGDQGFHSVKFGVKLFNK